MEMSCDEAQRYSLAVELGKLEEAYHILRAMDAGKDSAEARAEWRELRDTARREGNRRVADRCAERCTDLDAGGGK